MQTHVDCRIQAVCGERPRGVPAMRSRAGPSRAASAKRRLTSVCIHAPRKVTVSSLASAILPATRRPATASGEFHLSTNRLSPSQALSPLLSNWV